MPGNHDRLSLAKVPLDVEWQPIQSTHFAAAQCAPCTYVAPQYLVTVGWVLYIESLQVETPELIQLVALLSKQMVNSWKQNPKTGELSLACWSYMFF
jgi:hypothetical protein